MAQILSCRPNNRSRNRNCQGGYQDWGASGLRGNRLRMDLPNPRNLLVNYNRTPASKWDRETEVEQDWAKVQDWGRNHPHFQNRRNRSFLHSRNCRHNHSPRNNWRLLLPWRMGDHLL